MEILITGRHVEITEPLKTFVRNHLKKFPKLFVEPIDVHAVLIVEKHRQRAEIILKSKLFALTSIEETTDMYLSISKAVEKIERQALRQKEKVISHKRNNNHSGRSLPAAETAQAAQGAGSGKRKRIIVEELEHKKPMGVEEALIDLSESERNFVVFRDQESEGVHVLYRRKDGHFGLIRPE